MPYVVPTMSTVCRVWHNWVDGTMAYLTADEEDVPCNLSPGKRVMYSPSSLSNPDFFTFPMEILFLPETDIRAATNFGKPDLIECPSFTTRFYVVWYVDDIAKEFANQHRFSINFMVRNDTNWTDAGVIPFPVPLT